VLSWRLKALCGPAASRRPPDSDGSVVAAGRGRRYELTGPQGQLAGTHIAHAESERAGPVAIGTRLGARGTLAEILHIAFLLSRASAAHVLRAHDVAMPRLTAYARRIRDDLRNAVRDRDYQRAVEIAGAAPRNV
jgi:hypothetical protein